MRILIITQNEPFYLTKNLKYLLTILPENAKVIGCVVSDVSPFGKKESFFTKAKKNL
jgi:methionyl-tRNA formyltransferase